MSKRKNEVYVWPIYTRIIHWLIASSFTLSFIFSLQENLLNLHVAIGIIFGLMLVYRILWGFIGPKYALFSTLKLSLPELKFYFVEKVQNRYREIPAGHNPASSWFTLIVLSLGSVISITGLLLYGIQEGKGYLGCLNDHYYMHMDLLSNIHYYSAYILLAWVIIHILGVLVEQFYHKTNMAFAMITGFKKAKGKDSKPGRYKGFFSYIFLLISAMVFFVSVEVRDNPFIISKFKPHDYKNESLIYYTECGACHKVYPPFMLPASSWKKIQSGLKNHFGERISLEMKKDANSISLNNQKLIFNYLLKNSADTSTRELSVKLMKSLDGKRGRTSITKMNYWKETHSGIPRHIFKSEKVKRKANCFACHINFEKGIIEDIDISIP